MDDKKTTIFGSLAAIALVLKQQFSPEYGWIFDMIHSFGLGMFALYAKDRIKNNHG